MHSDLLSLTNRENFSKLANQLSHSVDIPCCVDSVSVGTNERLASQLTSGVDSAYLAGYAIATLLPT